MSQRNRHLKILVEYDGTDYGGFQRQKNRLSIQEELEKALRSCLKHEAAVAAAGRTDAGVHASGQVCLFHTVNRIPVDRIPLALNRLLPAAIRVQSAREVSADFHPRFCATSRVYEYTVEIRPIASALRRRFVWNVRRPLDIAAMQQALPCLVGRHDFRSFQASGSEMGGTVRDLYRAECRRRGQVVRITLEANAFLYQMVRTIVGTLVMIGTGDLPPSAMKRILQAKDRSAAGPTAPPQGLCLKQVKYRRGGRLRAARRAGVS